VGNVEEDDEVITIEEIDDEANENDINR